MTRLARLALLALALLSAGGTTARAALQPELDTSSPMAALRAFLAESRRIEALFLAYRDNQTLAGQIEIGRAVMRLGLHVFDVEEVAPAIRPKAAATAVGYFADIINRLPDPDPAPAGSERPARWTLPGTEIRFVRLTEGPRAGDYVVSAATVARLPDFHAMIIGEPLTRPAAIGSWRRVQERFTGPLLAGLPLEALPEALQAPLLDTPVWKVAFAAVIGLAVLAAILAWWRLVRRRSAGMVPWRRYAARLSVPLLTALLVLASYVFVNSQLILSGPVFDLSAALAMIALYGAAAWAAWLACWLIAEAVIASPAFPEDIYDANLLRLLARVGSLVAAATLLIFGANAIGVPALGLLAGVSVGGIALALAAQSTVENLFGGVSIFADRPFRVGDAIRYGGASGTVVAIGPRSSRIRAADGTVTTVPNADLAKMHVTNLSARDRWVFEQRIALPRDTPAARIVALLQDLERRVAAQPRVARGDGWPRVRLVTVGGSAIEIEIAAQVLTREEGEFLETQQALILSVLDAVEREAAGAGTPATPGGEAAPAVAPAG